MSYTLNVDPPELDLHVKGSLPTGGVPTSSTTHHHPPLQPTNPLEMVPSSPSQIYLSLLILEASLRSQYLTHLVRRRKFTFFLFILTLWTVFFSCRFFVIGGSPYYYISHLEKLGLGGGVVTGVLYYATGLYEKTIVEPRRFVFMANRGLRGFNVKLVKAPLSYHDWFIWWWGWYTFRPPPRHHSVKRRPSSNTWRPTPPTLTSLIPKRPTPDEEDEVEDYLPGGLHLKLVILPKGFSPTFREGWELYRVEYWEKENEARQIRRAEAKLRRHKLIPEDTPSLAATRRTRAGSMSSTRGRTPTPDPDQVQPTTARARRGSTASLKRWSITGLPLVPARAGTPGGDISDFLMCPYRKFSLVQSWRIPGRGSNR